MKLVGIQGDVVIWQVDKIPSSAKKQLGNVLVEGESTGHAHRVDNADIYRDGDRLYLQPVMPTIIEHEEHGEIPLQPEISYEITRQKEYKNKDMTVLVTD